MPRRTFFTAAPAVSLFVAASAGSAAGDEECRMFRILDDGSRIAVSSADGAASASASARSTGGSARSSVSVSSSSRDGGSSSVSSSTYVDGRSRTITTTQDENGCTITIDGRSATGDR